jgi:hypothetical protein
MGMSFNEFYTMRLSHFFLKLHGWRNEQDRQHRQHAELVRLQTVELLNIQLDGRKRFKSPDKLWQFPWDVTTHAHTDPGITENEARTRLQNALKSFTHE